MYNTYHIAKTVYSNLDNNKLIIQTTHDARHNNITTFYNITKYYD